jgi:hypothetical protein
MAELFSHLYARIYLAILAAANAGLWLFARYILSVIKDAEIALHYNVDFGIDYYGAAENIYTIPLISLVMLLINTGILLALRRSKDRKFIAQILMLAALVADLMLFTAMFSIYLINTR